MASSLRLHLRQAKPDYVDLRRNDSFARIRLVSAALCSGLALICALALPSSFASRTSSNPPQSAPSPLSSDRINWESIKNEAVGLLSRYIQINTTNPPGNELSAAKMLREKFLSNGIPAAVIETAPNRGIVAARLHGVGHNDGTIVLMSHIDVVPADERGWKLKPFSGAVKDGEVWGRGALDDKGPGVIELMAMVALKRAGILLKRDVLFLATADEEQGGRQGAEWVVGHRPDLFADVRYVLNEGGAIRVLPNGRKYYAVSVAEKNPLWVRLVASGNPGHAATPEAETAVTRLIQALYRVTQMQPQINVSPLVEDYFRRVAELQGGPSQWADVRSALQQNEFREKFLSNPVNNAMVRDTVTPTVLVGSDKTNVIPANAYAELDCRLLPGDNPTEFLKSLQSTIADDQVKVQVLLNSVSPASPTSTNFMKALEQVAERQDQGVPVIPVMSTGFTDSRYLRQHKLIVYGFNPIEITPELQQTIHGVNERIGIDNLVRGIQRMVMLLEVLGD